MSEHLLRAYTTMAAAFHNLTTAVAVEGILWAYGHQDNSEKYKFESYCGTVNTMIVDHDRAALVTLETWGGGQFTQEPDWPDESTNGFVPYSSKGVGEALYSKARANLLGIPAKNSLDKRPAMMPFCYQDEKGRPSTLVVDPETTSFTAWPDCRLIKITKLSGRRFSEEVIEGRVKGYNKP